MIDDTTAEKFAEYMKKYPHLYEKLALIVKKYMQDNQPFIIDLGVGPGLLSCELHKKIPKAKIIGIDPLPKMLQLAKKNACFDTFETKIGSSEKIPLGDNVADVVVSRFSLTYWKDPERSFKEINRVLKPGGKIILETLNRNFPKWKLLLIKLQMLFSSAGGDVTKYHIDAYATSYTLIQIEKFLINASFVVIEKKGTEKEWMLTVVAEK